jgi:hypothetical protein
MSKKRKPSYLLHKPTGQARVRIDGKDHYLGAYDYLGAYGSRESRERYDDLIAEWFTSESDASRYTLTIDDLALLYLEYAKAYYRMQGSVGRTRAETFRMSWHTAPLPVTECGDDLDCCLIGRLASSLTILLLLDLPTRQLAHADNLRSRFSPILPHVGR